MFLFVLMLLLARLVSQSAAQFTCKFFSLQPMQNMLVVQVRLPELQQDNNSLMKEKTCTYIRTLHRQCYCLMLHRFYGYHPPPPTAPHTHTNSHNLQSIQSFQSAGLLPMKECTKLFICQHLFCPGPKPQHSREALKWT